MMARAGMGTMNYRSPRVTDSARVWFNPDLKSRNYFVPGVVCNLLMVVTVTLTAMGIVREKRDRHHGTVDGDADPAQSS